MGHASAERPKGSSGGGDRAFALSLMLFGGLIFLLLGVIVLACFDLARPALKAIGWVRFLVGSDWDPVNDSFGALPFIYGTLVTSFIALLIATPVAVGMALFVTELARARLGNVVSFLVEVLAGIPSVIYGLWGLIVLVPLMRDVVEPLLGRLFGFLPLFRGPPIGLGYLTAGVLLAIMVLPTIASVTVAVLRTTPAALREGALALGATRWEAIRMVVLPHARRGILGAAILGLARALGETMAVTMVIGNQPEIHASLFAPGYSLPAVIANEFAEATGRVHTGALAALALVLFGLMLSLTAGARLLVRWGGQPAVGRVLAEPR